MKIEKEDRIIRKNPSRSQMDSDLDKIREKIIYYTEEDPERPVVLFVYGGGHGFSYDNKQVTVLNESESKRAQFNIEKILRILAE